MSETTTPDGVGRAARRAQQTWDRRRVEDYAAVVGVELKLTGDDMMEAVDQLYRAALASPAARPAARPAGHDHTRFRNDDGPWSPCPPSCPAAEPTGGLLSDEWWTQIFHATSDAVGHVPYAAASEYPVPHVAAFRAAAEPLLAPLLEKLRRVEAALRHIGKEGRISSFPLNVGYRDSAKIIARALDGS